MRKTTDLNIIRARNPLDISKVLCVLGGRYPNNEGHTPTHMNQKQLQKNTLNMLLESIR